MSFSKRDVLTVYCSCMAVFTEKKKQLKPTLRADIIIRNLKQKQKLWVSKLTEYEKQTMINTSGLM